MTPRTGTAPVEAPLAVDVGSSNAVARLEAPHTPKDQMDIETGTIFLLYHVDNCSGQEVVVADSSLEDNMVGRYVSSFRTAQ